MPNQDEHGFWDADPDWSRDDSTARVARVPRAPVRERTMFWRRTGAMVVVGLIAAPIALALRSTDPTPGLSTSAMATALQPAIAIDTTPATLAPEAGAAGQAAVVPALAPVVLGAAAAGLQNVETASTSASSAKASTARKTSCAKTYTVSTGDYWIMIARNQSVALKDLLAANGATIATPLYTGRPVCLPANAVAVKTASSTATTVAKTTSTTKKKSTATTTTVKVTASTAKPTPAKAPATTVKTATTTTAKTTTVKTTTTTTVAPTTTVGPPKNTYTRAQTEQIIRDVWPDDVEDKAVSIATRESNLIPTVRNACCFGLFQIYFIANKATLVAAGITSQAMLYDPRVNATAAYLLYLRSGWSPWGG